MNDTNEIKSIWDGWEKQCYGKLDDRAGGCCARGYLIKQVFPFFWDVEREVYARVVPYIREHYSLPLEDEDGFDMGDDSICIVYANNVLKLTPEQFREIDRLTRVEAVSKPLIDSVEIAVGVGR